MNPRQREQLEAHLRTLSKPEQDALYTRARALRAQKEERTRVERRAFRDIDEPRPGMRAGRKKNDPIQLAVLKLLAQDLAQAAGGGPDAGTHPGTTDIAASDGTRTHAGTAVSVGRRVCLVRPDGGGPHADLRCHIPADLAGRLATDLCVGDRVAFRAAGDARHARDEIASVLPRSTLLQRREPRTRSMRAVAANVDAAVIVVSAVSPPLHPRLIDRYLIALENSWVDAAPRSPASGVTAASDVPRAARPIIALNKADLLDTLPPAERDAELMKLDPYRAMGVPVVACSAVRAQGLDELRDRLAGLTVVFVGHSGVGKSSLANALDPRLGTKTGAVGVAANRGRHTTTSATLYEVDSDGVRFRVIDTPGVRSFGLDDLSESELRDSFPELLALRSRCRFADCTHTHEPGCAVVGALAASPRSEPGIHPARYDTYLRLLEDIRRQAGHDPGHLPTRRIRAEGAQQDP